MTDAGPALAASTRRPRLPAPGVRVVAVVVTRGATEYLDETLDGLAAQTRQPAAVLVADVEPDGGDARTLAAALDARWRGRGVRTAVVAASRARTFGDAVRTALTAADDGQDGEGWLWLLHDDSAPDPGALAELVRAVDAAPSVAVAGCKQLTWGEPVRVLEVGLTTSRFGRRMTGIDGPEVDQGQHDGREDVLGVGIAGALVRRDVWADLRGTDPALGPYGDGLDLSRRARLAGHRVVVVPRAVVRHAQASLARPVAGAVLNRPGWDVRRSARARREAYLHSQLAGVPAVLVPVVAVLAVLSGVARGLGRLVTKEPHLVVAELVAPWAVLLRPHRVARARASARRTARLRRRSLRPLQVSWREVVRQWRDRRLTVSELRRRREAPSELELTELAALRARRRWALAGVGLLALGVLVATTGPLVADVLGGARLTGGTLLPGDDGPAGVLRAVTSAWVPADLGHPAPPEPLLVALLPLTLVTGSLGGAAALVLLAAVPLAGLGAWAAAGAATRSTALRAWAALAWCAAPVLLVGLGEVRLGGVLAHVTLPWVVLGVARALGVARVDAVASGLVGARRPEEAGGDGEQEPAAEPDGDHATSSDEAVDAVREPADGPGRAVAASERADASHGLADDEPAGPPVLVPAVRTSEPSFAAAAGAGLGLAVVTAGAPVLLPAALVVLVLLFVVGPRRRRLAWVALPSLALHGPLVAEAVRTWGDGGWRLLLADPGRPVPGGVAPAWQQALGWPVEPPAWADPAGWGSVPALVATGAVVLAALVALVRGGRAVRATRVGWLVAAVGLATAVAATGTLTAVATATDGTTGVLVRPWHGPGLSLALTGLLAAALAGADGLRARLARHAFGRRQVAALVLTVLVVTGPLVTLGAWVAHVRAVGVTSATALRAGDAPTVPAVGRQMQQSADALRVLVLRLADDGVGAQLLTEDGRQLAHTSRAVTARQVAGGWGDPRPRPADDAGAEVADVVARLVRGGSDEVGADLAALGVGAVLVPPDRARDGERTALVGQLDSTLALERMTETEAGVVWRVAATEVGTTAAWARLVTPDVTGGVDAADAVPVPAPGRSVATRVAAGDATRLLVLAERADDGWRATLDGRPLRAVEVGWRQAFEVGEGAGRLVVVHDPPGRTPWLVLQGAVALVTLLLAVPVRRRRGGGR